MDNRGYSLGSCLDPAARCPGAGGCMRPETPSVQQTGTCLLDMRETNVKMLDESVDQGDLKINLYKTFQDSWKNQFNA